MSENQALEHIKNAELDLKTNWFLELFGFKFSDELAAADSYIKAANQYKIIGFHEKAAETFILAVKIYKRKSKHLIVSTLINSADCYNQAQKPELAIKYYTEAITILTNNSNFMDAAKYLTKLALIYESNGNCIDAIKSYQLAADYFDGTYNPQQKINCMISIANIRIRESDYENAHICFDKIADYYNNNTVLRYKYAEYCFNSLMCLMILGDMVACSKALERYASGHRGFSSMPEYKIIDSLIKYYGKGDLENFSRAIKSNNIYNKFKDWHDVILDQLKTKLEADDEYDLC